MTSEAIERIDGTKKRLLEAMENLVLERGFDAVSVRDITGVAKANVAAVNYHFGSREGLVQALVEQRLRPLVMLRQEELATVEKITDIEHLLGIWLMPMLTIQQQMKEDEIRYCRVMGRCLEMAHALPSAAVVQEMRKVDDAYLEKMMPMLPSDDVTTVRWKFRSCLGTLTYVLVHGHQMMPDFSLQAHIDLLKTTVFSSMGRVPSAPHIPLIEALPSVPLVPVSPEPPLIPEEQEASALPEDDGYGGKFLF